MKELEELMEELIFLHVDKHSQKLKAIQNCYGGYGQKWIWLIWSWESIIDCISKSTGGIN